METMPERRQTPHSALPKPNAALASHWPEYLMETGALGLFMISACVFGVLLEHPMSTLHQSLEDPLTLCCGWQLLLFQRRGQSGAHHHGQRAPCRGPSHENSRCPDIGH